MILKKKPVENIVGKEENAVNQHFLSFLLSFCIQSKTEISISAISNLSSANASVLIKSQILSFGKELSSIPIFSHSCFNFSKINPFKNASDVDDMNRDVALRAKLFMYLSFCHICSREKLP